MNTNTEATMTTMTTSDGSKIIGYGTYGSVRGYGPLRETLDQAERDAQYDRACVPQGSYSDRRVVAVDEDGACWTEDGSTWIPGVGGRTSGAARYSSADVADVAHVTGIK